MLRALLFGSKINVGVSQKSDALTFIFYKKIEHSYQNPVR